MARVTKATDDDLAVIAEAQALWTDAFPVNATWWVLDDAETAYLGADIEGTTLHVRRYYVAPESRGSGAGVRLVRAAMRWAKALGATRAATYTHCDNVASARNFIRLGWSLERVSHERGETWLWWGRGL